MTLKNAAFFAMVGMALMTVLLTINLVTNFSGLIAGFIPLVAALISLIQWIGSLSLLVFFIVFHRAQ